MKIAKANEVYKRYYDTQYLEFIRSDANKLTIQAPAPVGTPWNALSSKKDQFVKKTFSPMPTKGKIHSIKKNKKSHALLWETKAKTIKSGVRWGIIRTESITGQVISTLGQYRLIAHERIVDENNLMVSNTQALKLALLDVYQDRFEAMQELESLVNTGATKQQFKRALERYILKLGAISKAIPAKFSKMHLGKKGLNYETLPDKIRQDLEQDINNVKDYWWNQLNDSHEWHGREANRARGQTSILDFVKRQMHRNLYEFQGLNQDVVFSIGAWSRGEMNDLIVDATNLIDKHKPDLRNAVIQQHHGLFAPEEQTIVYDFSMDDLSPKQERRVRMALSFIEGFDTVNYTSDWDNPVVINQVNNIQADLTKISATKWTKHSDFFTSAGHYIANWFKGILYPTHPWEGNVEQFHTYASKLIADSKPDYPMWMKGKHFLQTVGQGIKDIFKGIRNFGQQFTLYLKIDLQDDWAATKKLPRVQTILDEANAQIKFIQNEEEKILQRIVKSSNKLPTQKLKILAQSEYSLSHNEEHDLLTAMVQGFGAFTGHFTDNLVVKDPVGAVFFFSAFAVGGAAIFAPGFTSSVFGPQYVHAFTKFSELVGSTPLSKAACGGLIQGQALHAAWGLATDGPSSQLVKATAAVIEDPVTSAFCFGAAYAIGYTLANCPGLGEYLREELGSNDLLNYPVIGVKFGVGVIMILVSDENGEAKIIEKPISLEKLEGIWQHLRKDPEVMREVGSMLQRVALVQWLMQNAPFLQKLDSDTQFEIERQIEAVFSSEPEKASSLKQMIHPEKERSIAYQIFAVPLGYIPALFRFGVSFILSGAAWLNNNPNWVEPIKRSGEALLHKTAKDITRVFNVLANLLFVTVNLLASPIKAIFLLSTMFIGRMTAFADLPSGHTMNKGAAFFHDLYRKMGEYLYPTRMMKSVVFADPIHTANEVMQTADVLASQTYQRFQKDWASNIKKKGELQAPPHHKNLFDSSEDSEKLLPKKVRRALTKAISI